MRILVTGASGQLGPYVVDELVRRGHDVIAWRGRSHAPDITDHAAVERSIIEIAPEMVVHLAALARPADAQRDPEIAKSINDEATRCLSGLCHHRGARFTYVSTDLVFDGDAAPYSEDQTANPLSEYARSKLAPERCVLDHGGTVMRTALMFGPSRGGDPNFFTQQVAALRKGESLRLFHDEYRTPLALCTAAAGLVEVCEADADTASGLYHLGGPERMNRVEFAQRLAAYLGVAAKYEATSRLDIDSPEPRPADVSLCSDKFYAAFPNTPRPSLEQALDAML